MTLYVNCNTIDPCFSMAERKRLKMDSGHVEESIKYSITKNGFPGKKVKLPFKPIFDSCKQNNTSLAEVLANLARENISGRIKGDYIEFHGGLEADQRDANASGDGSAFDPANWKNLQASAMEALSRMTPDQIAQLRRMAEGLSDEEKKGLMDMMTGQKKPFS